MNHESFVLNVFKFSMIQIDKKKFFLYEQLHVKHINWTSSYEHVVRVDFFFMRETICTKIVHKLRFCKYWIWLILHLNPNHI